MGSTVGSGNHLVYHVYYCDEKMLTILLDCSESIVTESDVVLDGSPLYPLRYDIAMTEGKGTKRPTVGIQGRTIKYHVSLGYITLYDIASRVTISLKEHLEYVCPTHRT